jgi:hypothetical protein
MSSRSSRQVTSKQSSLLLARRLLLQLICFESLQHSHVAVAKELIAIVYLASVTKPQHGVGRALSHIPIVAREHNMTLLMVICSGTCEDFQAMGLSSVWSRSGELQEKLSYFMYMGIG